MLCYAKIYASSADAVMVERRLRYVIGYWRALIRALTLLR